MDGGVWQVAVHGVAKSRTRLSDFTFTFHFHALEKEMATNSSILAWRVPGTEEPGALPSTGSPGAGHDWSDLAAATACMWGAQSLSFTACVLSCSVVSNSMWPHGLKPTRLLCPWNFPGKNTGVVCHFPLQGIFLTQGLNLCALSWQTDSLPRCHNALLISQ